jgi:hypothetical protein
VISGRGCHGKVIKVIIGTLIILGDHLERLAKSTGGQKFSLILGAKLWYLVPLELNMQTCKALAGSI